MEKQCIDKSSQTYGSGKEGKNRVGGGREGGSKEDRKHLIREIEERGNSGETDLL